MNTQLIVLLVAHIYFGIGAMCMHYMVWMNLAKENSPMPHVKKNAVISVWYLALAWLAGGYYYVTYYGPQVKPVIKAGKYAWAHSVFMETKEHVFLLLPFLAIALAVAIASNVDTLNSQPNLKKALRYLAGVSFWLGVFVTLSGAVISGAVR